MAYVYILYSVQLDKYYTGSCVDLEQRFEEHLSKKYIDSYTVKAGDWILFFSIGGLEYSQARNIELHIKKMKSRRYIENLKLYPEISNELIEKYKLRG